MIHFPGRKAGAVILLALASVFLSAASAAGADERSLAFDQGMYTLKTSVLDGKTISYRAYEGIVYIKNPVDTRYQTMNVYVRTEYFEGKSVNGYAAGTAPIFLPNTVGGYMPGAAARPGEGMEARNNAMLKALGQGFVVASPGARGRTLTGADGRYTGKAPAAIVDLKAAVRYLRFNDTLMPGDAERIVSNGTSAGGALSALLGATGNNPDYEPYLEALGAAKARDDIFAVSAYCPITNLDNADAAYEWLLGDLKETKGSALPPTMPGGAGVPPTVAVPAGSAEPPQGGAVPAGNAAFTGIALPQAAGAVPAGATGPWGAPVAVSAPLTAAQMELSAQLKALFPAYVNSLRLKKADGTALALDADGNGTFRDYVRSLLIASAQTALETGTDLSGLAWVTIAKGTVVDVDMGGYTRYTGRKKGVPAFDALDLSSGENNEFGSATVDNRHFTAFGQTRNSIAGATAADPVLVRMMNPMSYLGAPATDSSKLWRIRHGSVDSDTANAIPVLLAAAAANAGFSVDFAMPWDVPHSGDYDLPELFAWIHRISR